MDNMVSVPQHNKTALLNKRIVYNKPGKIELREPGIVEETGLNQIQQQFKKYNYKDTTGEWYCHKYRKHTQEGDSWCKTIGRNMEDGFFYVFTQGLTPIGNCTLCWCCKQPIMDWINQTTIEKENDTRLRRRLLP
eukprot:UN12192